MGFNKLTIPNFSSLVHLVFYLSINVYHSLRYFFHFLYVTTSRYLPGWSFTQVPSGSILDFVVFVSQYVSRSPSVRSVSLLVVFSSTSSLFLWTRELFDFLLISQTLRRLLPLLPLASDLTFRLRTSTVLECLVIFLEFRFTFPSTISPIFHSLSVLDLQKYLIRTLLSSPWESSVETIINH